MSDTFFLPCPRGLEQFLVAELKGFGAKNIETVPGGVQCEGEWELAWRANLESRIATRVLWKVGFGRYRGEDDIYRIAYATTWAKWFEPTDTIRVYVTAIKSPLKSLNFTTLRIKDGLCDHFRAVRGDRPYIDTEHPDMRIHAFLTENTCTLYLDTSGDALYKRGFKRAKVEAPLKENLAAGIIMLSGWQPGDVLLDPMCGSGTFLIEAAQMALDIAPGLGRNFAFERFRQHDDGAWRSLRTTVEQRRKHIPELPIFGSDIDPHQLSAAQANLDAAGLGRAVELIESDILDIEPPSDEGVLVTNPPYGVRLSSGEELADWYPLVGNVLKQRFAGWNCYFLSADMELAKRIGLKASKRTPLMNGDLDCRLFEYRIVAGQNRGKRVEDEQ
ncbi:THUMP domain-containing class I SAM-dependent RNA methyltransferase [Uliginosibacterium gangwonense]|uniref:THUMP domain-containing class I SAM-dependent RNA methyltransferase n=1 Tax=Uliginosibacterium gangwonense TaxID=392736 RepID=UPI00037E7B82|nr:THUMP domain-containing protein [Uliginosibacterium gangwonense]